MLTRHPITQEQERGFQVITALTKGKKVGSLPKSKRMVYSRRDTSSSCYPFFNSKEAIETMKTLRERGFDCVAYTKGQNFEENLSLEEMQELID